MKASKISLECAETILSHHIIDNRVTSLRALTRDIALSIDMAEEAAAAPLREEVDRLRGMVTDATNIDMELRRQISQLEQERDAMERQIPLAKKLEAVRVKESLIERVREKALVYRNGIGGELSDECKRELRWQAIALNDLANELEKTSVHAEQNV